MDPELERTEELLSLAKKRQKKKKSIIAGIILAVVAMGAGVFAGITIHNENQVSGKLNTAQQYLMEGKYEEAIQAFDKIIALDDSNADAYEGRGDAKKQLGRPKDALKDYEMAIERDKEKKSSYDKAILTAEETGDEEKAEEILEKKKKQFDDAGNETVGSINMGCTPENLAAGGIVCEKDGVLYIANKPKRGCISKMDSKGKEETFFEYPELGEKQYISRMNVWDGWMYYAVMEMKNPDDELKYEVGRLRRVRLDGTHDEEIKCAELQRLESMAIIKGKIYYTLRNVEWKYSLYECNLDGSKKRKICNDCDYGGSFATDGISIYHGQESEHSDDLTASCDIVERRLSEIDKPEIIGKGYGGVKTFLQSKGKISFSEDANGAPDALSILDIKTKKSISSDEIFDREVIINALSAYKNYIVAVSDYNYGDDEDIELKKEYEADFYFVDSKNGKIDSSKGFTLKIPDSEIGSSDEADCQFLFAGKDRMYYQIFRGSTVAPIFGSVSIDGKDNTIFK